MVFPDGSEIGAEDGHCCEDIWIGIVDNERDVITVIFVCGKGLTSLRGGAPVPTHVH
jgi:hypothetical protein